MKYKVTNIGNRSYRYNRYWEKQRIDSIKHLYRDYPHLSEQDLAYWVSDLLAYAKLSDTRLY